MAAVSASQTVANHPSRSPPMSELPRPAMRRKSSAQNLLTSFKTPAGPSSSGGSMSAATGAAFAAAAAAQTQSPNIPPGREWDGQSVHSDTLSSTAALVGNGTPVIAQGTSVEYLRDLVQKRIITLTYMRTVHEGRSDWFHTIMMSRTELDKVFNNITMKKRTHRFATLAMSLSNLLDIPQAQDYLRGLLNTMNEYDQAKEEPDKPKIRLFRPKAAFAEYNVPFSDGTEASYLVSPHIPFPLDYHQTLLSLLDVISEVYNKISRILGPSPFSNSGQHMMGPLGLLAPHPGVSYLFSGQDSLQRPTDDGDGSLWGIANAHITSHGYGGAMGSPPPSWTPALGDTLLKVDAKFKKITSTLLKELDAVARNGIKDELASLDPLLRNVTSPVDVREQYDFEGHL
ncbi:hypothetical protein F5J12DRAFT_823200 [Pisolithus orientalis]|uniref:uncharacterized protein n=1 Tax=Pisolithus orientalis TaxID=936130 RepID=UPI002224F534|nr:uncharacterized protein F5J12DRAFT_823200 [Pisolithus orientalis]KAI6009382.1 hypothetical protein F5J12DRAFT_823200 [Pisolithus orientalis]